MPLLAWLLQFIQRLQTHSVIRSPGKIAFTRSLGPWVAAKHLTRCRPDAFVTAYGIELSVAQTPATDEVTKNTPPSTFFSKIGMAFCIKCKWAFTFTDQH